MAQQRTYADGYHKAIYFFENGRIPVLPTHGQFRAACAHQRLSSTVRLKAGPFLRRLFSKESFQRKAETSDNADEVVAGATMRRFNPGAAPLPEDAARRLVNPGELRTADVDPERGGWLARLLQMDVLRAIAMTAYNPVLVTAGLGFRIPASWNANHLLFSPHPCEHAVWDLQLIQGDPGGLELLERRTEEARKAKSLRGRVLSILGTHRTVGSHRFELVRTVDPDTGWVRYVDATLVEAGSVVTTPEDWNLWYDHMRETIERARRFEYAVRPADQETYYPAPTITRFLELAAQLEPKDFAFFRNRDPFGTYPEISWPRFAE